MPTMRAMRALLVASAARASPEALPLGAASVAAALRSAFRGPVGSAEEGFRLEASVLDLGPDPDPDRAMSRIASYSAGAVGLSAYSWNADAMAEIARALRAAAPETIVFAGGPEVTARPESFLRESGADFAIVGEGEAPVVEAFRALAATGTLADRGGDDKSLALADALRDIEGIALPGLPWRRPSPADPATLASPWLSGTLDPAAFSGDLVWELARGCPFRCAYCYESKGQGGIRPFPMERIEAELELFLRSGVRYAFVLDPTFDAEPRRAAALLDLFRQKAPGIRWKFEIRAELLDRGLARRFAALDCTLQIGLQSAKASTLAAIGRPGFERKDFARRTALLDEAGASFGLDLIYGLPGDSLRDFEESLDFALGLGPNHLDVFPLALLPGTDLAERAAELGIEADPRPPYRVRSTRELLPGDLDRATRLAEACDRFYSGGRAVAWFGAALAPLKQRPSAFLEEYSRWRGSERAGGRHREIEVEQLGFLRAAYARRGLQRVLPALEDLVRLHGAYGRALAEGESTELELSYDPEEALAAPAIGLTAFARSGERSPGSWIVLPDEEEGARIEEARGHARGAGKDRGSRRRGRA